LSIRALLTGPLAQFGRGAIVEDIVARITAAFARNLEAQLSGNALPINHATTEPLQIGTLVRQAFWARLNSLIARVFGRAN
ncbi:MAG TPA: hypothetical protein VFP96_05720, partial [Candidatus Acidoferrum sp.]|nr:hypothetical protein [Candidatus Acidoferrum sp.]